MDPETEGAALHTIGLDRKVGRRLYSRNRRRYYKPFRNHFYGNNRALDRLVEAGYMKCSEGQASGRRRRTYWFTRPGLDWLGGQIGIIIKDVE